MNKKNIILQKIDGIYDIQPPTEPAINLLEKSLLSLLLILAISLSIYFTWKIIYSNKAIAKRKIKELYKHYTKTNSHDTAYQLILATKQGLKLNRLNKDTPLPDKLSPKKQQWQTFIRDISSLRYKKNTPSNIDINKLYLDCLFWLKVWP